MKRKTNLDKICYDYSDLFLRKRSGHLTEYAYTGKTDYFNLLIRRNRNYYISRLESELLRENIATLSLLIGVKINLIEIGPGPEYSINTKVIPFIKGLCNPLSYTAIDAHIRYAKGACQNVKRYISTIKTNAKQLDCSKLYNLSICSKKCILFLGSTICNFTDEIIKNIFTNFYNALREEDFLVFTVDYNHDSNLLEKAYDNVWMHKFTLAIMFYFQNIFHPIGFDAKKFVSEYEWNAADEAVHMNVVATEDQSFDFNSHRISIPKNSKYHVITSRKFRSEFIENMITMLHFTIRERFCDKDQKVCLYLLQK